MTARELIRMKAQIAVLKEVLLEYGGKTIDNIIPQLEARVKHFKTDDGWEDLEKDELPIEDMAEFPEEYRLKNKPNESKCHYYYYVVTTSDNGRLCGCVAAEEGFPLSKVKEYLVKTRSLDKDKIFVSFFAEVSKEEFDLWDK